MRPSVSRFNLILLVLLLVGAAAIRRHGLFHDLPFSYYGDEMHFVERSVALGTGDLNPHWFHKPASLNYLLLLCYGTYFGVAHLAGQFESPEAFGAYFLAYPGSFLLIGRLLVAVFGVGTVYVIYLMGRKIQGSVVGGLMAAFVAACLPAMVAGSQVVKADVPAAFFVVLSIYAFLHTRENAKWTPLLTAGALAGVGMGTKYYGIILIPPIVIAELARRFTHQVPWSEAGKRVLLVCLVFTVAFFVTSPFNFLDPTWRVSIQEHLGSLFAAGRPTSFQLQAWLASASGLGDVPGATQHLLKKLIHPSALGPGIAVLAGLGFLRLTLSPRKRWYAFVLVTPLAVFMLLAVTVAPYRVGPRHLNVLFPLICPMVLPGALLLTRILPLPARASTVVGILLVFVVAGLSLIQSVRNNLEMLRPDSRTVAHDWIVATLPTDARILLDDYGPSLQPNATAVERLKTRLQGLPSKEAFTYHQARRLDLLWRYPPRNAFDIEELGHPWWLEREMADDELRNSWVHRDMGNPLIDRRPRSIEAYRAGGIRYIITNSEAQQRYLAEEAITAFPSFSSFYRGLKEIPPMETFDPGDWGGKGPVVWIYDIQAR